MRPFVRSSPPWAGLDPAVARFPELVPHVRPNLLPENVGYGAPLDRIAGLPWPAFRTRRILAVHPGHARDRVQGPPDVCGVWRRILARGVHSGERRCRAAHGTPWPAAGDMSDPHSQRAPRRRRARPHVCAVLGHNNASPGRPTRRRLPDAIHSRLPSSVDERVIKALYARKHSSHPRALDPIPTPSTRATTRATTPAIFLRELSTKPVRGPWAPAPRRPALGSTAGPAAAANAFGPIAPLHT
jgi:hypothetical protein